MIIPSNYLSVHNDEFDHGLTFRFSGVSDKIRLVRLPNKKANLMTLTFFEILRMALFFPPFNIVSHIVTSMCLFVASHLRILHNVFYLVDLVI